MYIKQVIIQGFKRSAPEIQAGLESLTLSQLQGADRHRALLAQAQCHRWPQWIRQEQLLRRDPIRARRRIHSDESRGTQCASSRKAPHSSIAVSNSSQEGTGAAVMSAFVEIIFDNSDDRFPTGKPEVILRRTIGMKKDEYSLDRKNATRTDVMNLLESAGFSRSNPYYIVPQGRVTALTNMKDPERLNLLKEVAGTQVYEARRTESLKIMQETTNKRDKIDDLLDYIKERLTELEEEKEELRDFQEKDKDRRCLQYALDYREQEQIEAELENLDEHRTDGATNTEEKSESFLKGEKDIA